jgi:hypothetical protein
MQDGLDKASVHRLKDFFNSMLDHLDGLSLCLSEDGDLLSQWRGYAADGTGVAIGFDSISLEQISERLLSESQTRIDLTKVEYTVEEQDSLVRPTYEKMRKHIDAGAFKTASMPTLLDLKSDDEIEAEKEIYLEAFSKLWLSSVSLIPKLFSLKSPAFREEKEWRLISVVERSSAKKLLFRSTSDSSHIVPYSLLEVGGKFVRVREVILGPKNSTPKQVIESLLIHNGFEGVEVKASSATYR